MKSLLRKLEADGKGQSRARAAGKAVSSSTPAPAAADGQARIPFQNPARLSLSHSRPLPQSISATREALNPERLLRC